jgi:hypothetical protein
MGSKKKKKKSMMDDSRLPIQGASADVWEDLRQLRDDVDHVISKSHDGDKDKMWPMFEKIDQVYRLRLFASQESGLSDHLLAPSSKTWAIARPRLSARERPLRNRYSDASGSSSTVVSESRYAASPTKETDFRGAVLRHS